MAIRTIVVRPASGNMIRVRLHAPHPVWGDVAGHAVYGIRDIRVSGSSSSVVVRDCAEAAQNVDARDQFLLVAVPEFDPHTSTLARETAALLVAAEHQLGSLLSELEVASASCNSFSKLRNPLPTFPVSLFAANVSGASPSKSDQDPEMQAIAAIVKQLEVDHAGLEQLIQESSQKLASVL